MIGLLHEIRDIAVQIQTVSSIHDTKNQKIARIIAITDEAIDHFTNDGRYLCHCGISFQPVMTQ